MRETLSELQYINQDHLRDSRFGNATRILGRFGEWPIGRIFRKKLGTFSITRLNNFSLGAYGIMSRVAILVLCLLSEVPQVFLININFSSVAD